MKYFFIIKEKIAYIECVIQSSMFYGFYLFLSILHCNIDSALVSDSNAYIWIPNCIQMFDLYSNVQIYIRMLKECVFSTCSWKMASSDNVGKKISELHQELLNSYKKRFMCEKGQVAVVKCSPIWKKICEKISKHSHSICTESEGSCEQTWQRGLLWTNVTKRDGGGGGG